MEGKTINGFELKRLLGVGGMAEVWYAENEIGKPAAVKMLNEDLSHNTQIVDRFRNEAVVMVKLDHNNIRQVYGYGTIDGRPAIVMEYLEGDDLKAMMKQGRRFKNDELVKWWNQLVDALNYTHAQGIVHRDIKPSNIFLDKKGNIKLLDFGIAKIRESISVTHTGATLGTLMYMSPEQVDDAKHLGPQSDVYSLAVTFVHLLTGKAPYDSTTMSDFKIRESIVYKPLDLSGVSTEWQDLLTPYLSKEPEKRPALRPFESVSLSGKPEEHSSGGFAIRPTENRDWQSSSDGEGTLAEEKPQPIFGPSTLRQAQGSGTSNNNPSTGNHHSGLAPLSPAPKDNPKSKKTLWITLVIIVAVAALLISLLKRKASEIGNIVTDPGVIEAPTALGSNNKDLNINANGVNITMKFVQGGTFQMGSNDSDAQYDEQPVHNVTVNTFFMGETEVTQALWKAVMGNNNNPSYWKGDNLPVEQVSWSDCQEFIRKLNQLTDKNFRLPTEAEWEFAAQGGNNTNHNKYAGSNTIGNVAWYDDNSNNQTHSVRTKSHNELGLYDMSGNVWEWCQDRYGYYANGSQTNPQGPSNGGSFRVLRGGSWDNNCNNCRVSNRSIHLPDNGNYNSGFRLALSE